jgi:SPP1 gp7 family putative phage head morphogenesis protein
MAKQLELSNIAVRRQVHLERLKTSFANEAKEALNALGPAAEEVLASIGVNNITDLTAEELKGVIATLEARSQVIIAKALEGLVLKLVELAGAEAAFEAKTLDKNTKKSVNVNRVTGQEAYAYAKENPIAATGEMLDAFLENYTAKQVAQLSGTIARGYANGVPTAEIVRAIKGTKKLSYADGIVEAAKHNITAIVRTAVQHVASAARFSTWEANRDILDGYKIVATLDSRTSQLCRSLDKTVYKLDSGPRPPLHINCRSTTVAVINKFAFLDEGATRSAEKGPVDARLTYYDWLKEQSAPFQDSAIGPTRGELLRKGGLSSDKFAKLNLGSNFEPLTLAEMRKLEPLAFERAGI